MGILRGHSWRTVHVAILPPHKVQSQFSLAEVQVLSPLWLTPSPQAAAGILFETCRLPALVTSGCIPR